MEAPGTQSRHPRRLDPAAQCARCESSEPRREAIEAAGRLRQSVAGAVTTGPTSTVHKAKAKMHKAKAKQHTKKAKAAMDQANKNAPPPPAVGEKAN